MRSFGVFLIALVSAGLARAETTQRSAEFDCSSVIEGISLPAICGAWLISAEDNGRNLMVSGIVDLGPLVQDFHTFLANRLDRRSCRERVSVKSASLQVQSNALLSTARIWVEKRLCESFVKTRIFEKTADIVVRFRPQVSPEAVALDSEILSTGLNDVEEAVIEFTGTDPTELIKSHLDSQLQVRTKELGLPTAIAQTIRFEDVSIIADPPSMRIQLSARFDGELLQNLLTELAKDR